MTRSLLPSAGWIRRALLGAVILAGAAVALGRFGASTTRDPTPADATPSMKMKSMTMTSGTAMTGTAPTRTMPPLDGATGWLNGPPLTAGMLQGKVVLVDFWTYSSISCLRAMPFVEAWSRKYRDTGLVVIGVHSPEFAFERDPANVATATHEFEVTYPIALDADRVLWGAFGAEYRPTRYLIDATGVIRFQHLGEGGYDETESLIQDLLQERNAGARPRGTVRVNASGVQAAPDLESIQSPETNVGYERQENFASPQPLAQDRVQRYTAPASLELNEWALANEWRVGSDSAVPAGAGARIVFRFHARDLHLVLGPRPDGQPVRFRVSIDGRPPLDAHGLDVDSRGAGLITTYRLYQLIRQQEPGEDRTFQIEFLDPGAQAFAFTFG